MVKSYTSKEQSEMLIKLGIPIETADMEYMFLKKDGSKVSNVPFVKDGFEEPECCYTFIPCWSLTALINIIPQEIFDGEYIINITEGLNNRWILTYDHYERNNSFYGLSSGADNLVDACYKMIIKLNKLNMI